MNNEPVFDEAEQCDACGALGAYDFGGDCYCPICAQDLYTDTSEDDTSEICELEY